MRLLTSLTLAVLILVGSLRAEEPALGARLVVYNPSSGPVRFILRVENLSGVPQTVSQPTSQSHDFVVTRDGREVWRWSADKFFLQTVTERVFPPGQTTAFEGEWERTDQTGKRAPTGTYQVEAWLPGTNLRTSRKFSL